jgi:hypothetical protein
MKLKNLLTTTLVASALLLSSGSVMGQLLLTEDFNYTVGEFIGGNGDAGAVSNNWTTHSVTAGQTTTLDIIEGSLTYSGLAASTGNKVFIPGANTTVSRDVNRPFVGGTEKVMYFSALVNIVDATQLSVDGDYFMSFGATDGSAVTVLGARTGVKSSGTGFRFLIRNHSGGTPTWTDNGQDLAFGTTYLIVVKYDINAALTVATMWVNPTGLGGAEPAGGFSNNSGTANTFIEFKSICIRNGGNTPKANIDEIRVGTTWASVTPLATGVETNGAFANFTAYPNPFSNQITISNPAAVKRVVVSNLIGQNVLDISSNGTATIETSSLSAGVYMVSFVAENGTRLVKKMIKK